MPPVSRVDGGDVHDAMMLDLSKRGGVGKGRSERRSRWTKSDKSAAAMWGHLSRTAVDEMRKGGGGEVREHDTYCPGPRSKGRLCAPLRGS